MYTMKAYAQALLELRERVEALESEEVAETNTFDLHSEIGQILADFDQDHNIEKAVQNIFNVIEESRERCIKCGGLFAGHHHKHITQKGVYHTKCYRKCLEPIKNSLHSPKQKKVKEELVTECIPSIACGCHCHHTTCSCLDSTIKKKCTSCYNPTPKPSKDLTPQDVLMNQAIDDAKNEVHPVIDTKPSRCKACACFCAIGCQCSCHIIKPSKQPYPKYVVLVEERDKQRKALEEIQEHWIDVTGGAIKDAEDMRNIAKEALKDD